MKKKFKITISKDCFTSKPDKVKDLPKMHWIPVEADDYDIMNYTMKGYSVTGDYGFTTEFHRGRTQANWKSSPFIFIDIDDSTLEWDELCKTMIKRNDYLKATYIYTTFSHGLEGKGNRYRIVYVFDEEIKDSKLYKAISAHYNTKIKELLNLDEEVDNCNVTMNQLMHGTHSKALLARGSNTPKLADLCGVLNYNNNSDNCHINNIHTTPTNTYNVKNRKNVETVEYFSREEIVILRNTSYTDYIKKHSTEYFIYRDNWHKLGNEATQKEVINVMPNMYWNKETQSREPYKLHDGQHRKNKLKTVCRKIRAINPDITKEELLYNTVNWMYNYIFQDDDPITWKDIISIVNGTLNESVDDYLTERLKWLTEPNKVLKNPYIKVERKKRVSTKERDIEFSKLKDTSIETIMNTMKVSERTAYRYKEKYEEKLDNKKLIERYMIEGKTAKEIMELTGLKKSQVYNLIKIIKESGAKEVNVEINITNNIEDNSTKNIEDNSTNFNLGNDALKYFKDEESMKEFFKHYKQSSIS